MAFQCFRLVHVDSGNACSILFYSRVFGEMPLYSTLVWDGLGGCGPFDSHLARVWLQLLFGNYTPIPQT